MDVTRMDVTRKGPTWHSGIVEAPLVLVTAVLVALSGACSDSATETPASLRLEALPTIGSDSGDGPETFGDIVDIEIGDDGSLFVLDGPNRVVQVFTAAGTHVRSIGQRGSGPGEFENPVALALAPSGDLWVVDSANRRYTVFTADGRLVDTYRRPDAGVVLPWPGGFTSDGQFFDVTFEFGPQGVAIWLLQHELTESGPTEVDRFEIPLEEIPTFEYEDTDVGLMLPIPFTAQPLSRIGPDGELYEANTGSPWVRRRALGSDDGVSFGREAEPVAVTAEERARALENEDARELRALGGAEALSDFAALIPDTKPPLAGFFVDDEDRLWMMMSTADSAPTPLAHLDVYDQDGALVGSTEAAILADPWPRLKRGLLAGVRRDDLGVEYLATYRVR